MTIFDDATPFDEITLPSIRSQRAPLNSLTGRISADPETVERGLVQLVLTLVELLRQLMERQAVRRLDAGAMTPEETERVGRTLMLLENAWASFATISDSRPRT